MSNGEGRELSVNKSFAEYNNSSERNYENPGDIHSTNSDIFSALPGTLTSLRPTNFQDDTKQPMPQSVSARGSRNHYGHESEKESFRQIQLK